MFRKSLLPSVALLASLVLAPARSNALTASVASFWTSDFVGFIRSYNLGDQTVVSRLNLRGMGWRVGQASSTGTLQVTVDSGLNAHSVLNTDVVFTDNVNYFNEPATAVIDATMNVDGTYSLGATITDANDGTTVLYSSGTDTDGLPSELPVTHGSIVILP